MILRNVGLLLVALLAAPPLAGQVMAQGQTSDHAATPQLPRLGLQGVGAPSSPLQRPVTVNVADMELGKVLTEISAQAGIGLVYETGLIPVGRRLTVRLDSTAAAVAFRRVLEGTDLDFSAVNERQVVIFRKLPTKPSSARRAQQQAGTIIGRVTEKGTETPVVGAQVLLDGVGRAITNPEGRYRITDVTPGKHTVSVVSIGYRGGTQEVELGDGATVVVDFTLEAAPTQLSELVVTATGEERRRVEIGNDIVVINVDSIMKREPISSVTDLLEGRVPGLVVQRSSGAPGDPARIRIRGVSSPRGSNDPIVVVDGIRVHGPDSGRRGGNLANGNNTSYAVPSPLDYIDPHTIQTIQVLKGPSAATIYGQDAANGVIVITTKKGRAGKTTWNASIEHGRKRIPGEFPELYLRWGHRVADSRRVHCPINGLVDGRGPDICQPGELLPQQLLNDSDHTILGEGRNSSMSVRVSGGNTGLTYSVTASYRDEVGLPRLPGYAADAFKSQFGREVPEWMQRPQSLEQWNVSSSLTMDLGGSAKATLSSMLSRVDQQRSSLENELGRMMTRYLDPVTGTIFEVEADGAIRNSTRDLLEDFRQRANSEATEFANALNITWPFKSWLTLTADAGINALWRADAVAEPFRIDGSGEQPARLRTGTSTSVIGTVRVGAHGEVPLGLGFRLRMATGVDFKGETVESVVSEVDLPPGRESLEGSVTPRSVNGTALDDAAFGWYIEPGITHGRMYLNLGLRFDGGSAYGAGVKGLKLPKFPRLNYSYAISEEPYFPDALRSVFNTLRLRVAYGHAGIRPGPTDKLRLYGAPVLEWVSDGMKEAVTLRTLGNNELRPERVRELEWGFEADLFDDLVSVVFTAYRKTTNDAIVDVPVAPSVYGTDIKRWENIGVVRNTGIELGLGIEPIRTDLLAWRANLQLSSDRNVVVELGDGVEPFYTDLGEGRTRVAAGYPLFGRWAKPVLGYTDRNGDGVLDPGEIVYGDTAVYVGSTLPEFSASLHSTFSLFRGALSISAGLLYEDGMTQFNTLRKNLRAFTKGWNTPSAQLDGQLPALDRSEFTSIQTVNSLRLNSLSATYTVPTRVARRFGASSLSLSIQGTNLGLWTNYSGLDPNVNGSVTGNNVVDTGVIPTPRTWQIRVNATY